ncbi:hypothetical protein AXK57_21790 [Tsukamurella pulmonis]|uniref:hypothetical protein n=1 Tax=Tsukamurella pulmonis TaxID=47312 RepID=UPI0007912E97|nr:hypothetical protein [Tsukamurella pulmonis]KXP11578.1 hypothetical protein AXK57_21790 [Tsukamurella pulmonis]
MTGTHRTRFQQLRRWARAQDERDQAVARLADVIRHDSDVQRHVADHMPADELAKLEPLREAGRSIATEPQQVRGRRRAGAFAAGQGAATGAIGFGGLGGALVFLPGLGEAGTRMGPLLHEAGEVLLAYSPFMTALGTLPGLALALMPSRAFARLAAPGIAKDAAKQFEQDRRRAAPPPPRRATVEDCRQALAELRAAWGRYRLDNEAWYLTMPALRDNTGTIPEVVAYQDSMTDLIQVVDELRDDSPQPDVDRAALLAEAAWTAWSAAQHCALDLGTGGLTATERASLAMMRKLVDRLAHSSPGDPELPTIKRQIQDCMDQLHTVPITWADVADQPAIKAAGTLRALTERQETTR